MKLKETPRSEQERGAFVNVLAALQPASGLRQLVYIASNLQESLAHQALVDAESAVPGMIFPMSRASLPSYYCTVAVGRAGAGNARCDPRYPPRSAARCFSDQFQQRRALHFDPPHTSLDCSAGRRRDGENPVHLLVERINRNTPIPA